MPNRVLLALAGRPGLERFITKRRFTRNVAARFVAGYSLEDGVQAAAELESAGLKGILDFLGENVTNESQADAAAGAYLRSLDSILERGIDCHISVKLTQLGLDLSIGDCVRRMEKICAKAGELGTVVAIDMESHEYTDATIETYRRLRADHSNLVLCLQAYLKRTCADVEGLMPLRPAIRLCKGAYNELPEISLGRKKTRQAYVRIMEDLLRETPYTAIATHDHALIDAAREFIRTNRIPEEAYEFQMLYGVRRELQSELASKGHGVRIYIPFGEEWYPYLMRRLAERPANLRFFARALLRG